MRNRQASAASGISRERTRTEPRAGEDGRPAPESIVIGADGEINNPGGRLWGRHLENGSRRELGRLPYHEQPHGAHGLHRGFEVLGRSGEVRHDHRFTLCGGRDQQGWARRWRNNSWMRTKHRGGEIDLVGAPRPVRRIQAPPVWLKGHSGSGRTNGAISGEAGGEQPDPA